CDGTADNGFNKQTNPNHCGSCNNVCSFPNAIAGCSAGACTIAQCLPGFANLNNTLADGCEHTCAVSPPSTEVCDGVDNDCDNLVDGADPGMASVSNFCVQTGPCNGAAPVCQGAQGWRCNYAAIDSRIQTQPDGSIAIVETLCDNFDNNCNTQADETFSNKGQACSVGVGRCAGAATYTCRADQAGTECLATAQPTQAIDELCNGTDDNCDGQVDERNPTGSLTCYNGGAHGCLGYQDPMVQIGSVWMYRYEASRPDATDTLAGSVETRACSTANVLPWASVNQAGAVAACGAIRDSANNPMRLCTETEWQTACLAGGAASPSRWSYSSSPTTYVAGRCNDADAATPAGIWASGTGAECYSPWGGSGIFDLSGNVAEWTSSCLTLAGKTYCRVRGGNTATLAAGATCDFSFVLQQNTFRNYDVGFRCCSGAAP
ncbi:MAG: SUMF1/EgtB/PvdO family nonheme iron enzyme, partial [Polyangiaceae bacterium]|nr:SUMF1/EgtB/PvdO family nonheme iron enzyme [Polyangiaceae bacterium]